MPSIGSECRRADTVTSTWTVRCVKCFPFKPYDLVLIFLHSLTLFLGMKSTVSDPLFSYRMRMCLKVKWQTHMLKRGGFRLSISQNFESPLRNTRPCGRIGEPCKHPSVMVHVMLGPPTPTLTYTPDLHPSQTLMEGQDRMWDGWKFRDCSTSSRSIHGESLCTL